MPLLYHPKLGRTIDRPERQVRVLVKSGWQPVTEDVGPAEAGPLDVGDDVPAPQQDDPDNEEN